MLWMTGKWSSSVVRTWLGLSVALGACWLVPAPARGQSLGYGASPGPRYAYRPTSQWNNGPYYTVPHWNAYAPHRTSPANLYDSMPLVPPWTTGPHGLYPTFFPGQGTLYRYAEGFSPYSGFSNWYAQDYRVDATREVVQQARTMFFRSAPRPPEGVLPPLPPARPVPTATQPTRPAARPVGTPVKVVAPARPAVVQPAPMVPVYRGSVLGNL
jgi:hypothetical protein